MRRKKNTQQLRLWAEVEEVAVAVAEPLVPWCREVAKAKAEQILWAPCLMPGCDENRKRPAIYCEACAAHQKRCHEKYAKRHVPESESRPAKVRGEALMDRITKLRERC